MKILPVVAEFDAAGRTDRQTDRHTDRQTDRHTDRQTDMTKITADFHNFANAP